MFLINKYKSNVSSFNYCKSFITLKILLSASVPIKILINLLSIYFSFVSKTEFIIKFIFSTCIFIIFKIY